MAAGDRRTSFLRPPPGDGVDERRKLLVRRHSAGSPRQHIRSLHSDFPHLPWKTRQLPWTRAAPTRCRVRDDQLPWWCWGQNGWKQLGDGTSTNRTTPTRVGTVSDWSSVSAGGLHTCGVRTDGTAWCWGHNFNGQLGDGTTTDRTIPIQIGTTSDWAMIRAGSTHTCGVRTDGTAWCWGSNWFWGALGDGTTTDRNTPTQVGTDTRWISITVGVGNTCAIRTDGTAWCWGSGFLDGAGGVRQSGSSRLWNQLDPDQCGVEAPPVVCVAQARRGAGATTFRDRLGTAPPNTDGIPPVWARQPTGRPSRPATDTPAVPGGTELLSAGAPTTAARSATPLLFDRHVPTQLSGNLEWTTITVASGQHTCGIRSDGRASCWGSRQSGQLGDGFGGFATSPAHLPAATPARTTGSLEVSTGTCGLATDRRRLWCWGGYTGTSPGTDTPTRLGSASDWAGVSAGYLHSCGLRDSGTAFCWGYGSGWTDRKRDNGSVSPSPDSGRNQQ